MIQKPQLPKPHLVVIGNGMAGCRAVEEILARDAEKYRITIFGAEPRVNYNRIMLSPLLAGEKSFDDIVINDHAWYSDNDIDLVTGDAVVAIDRKIQTVTARSGRTESYDKLMLATGSDPFRASSPSGTWMMSGPCCAQHRAEERLSSSAADCLGWKRRTGFPCAA
jgi:nitrite reductase (NADH) large subunit